MDRKTQIWARCGGAAATASAGCKAAREHKLPPEIFPLLFTLLEPKREEERERCFAEAEDYKRRGLNRAWDSPGRILGGLRLPRVAAGEGGCCTEGWRQRERISVLCLVCQSLQNSTS